MSYTDWLLIAALCLNIAWWHWNVATLSRRITQLEHTAMLAGQLQRVDAALTVAQVDPIDTAQAFTGDIVCGAIYAQCYCTAPPPHQIHSCQCGGSWAGREDDGTLAIYSYPDLGRGPIGPVIPGALS